MYVLVIPYFNILFIVSFNFHVILFHKLSCKWQHSCKRMASANDFHYAVIYCVLSVSRKHTNWLIMFVLLHFGFPSNHLSYIYVGTFNYIKYKLRENGMLSTASDMCRHFHFHWSKSLSAWLIRIHNILRLPHFLLVDFYNEVWMKVWVFFFKGGICCETHNVAKTACA